MFDYDIEDVYCYGDFDNDIFDIHWSLTSYCNYRCSYCSAGALSLKNATFTSFEEIKFILDVLFSLNRKKYILQFAGGEPTIHPKFIDILKYLNDLSFKDTVFITTNGSKDISFFDECFFISKDLDLQFRISIHPQYVNLEHIKAVINLANKYNKIIGIILMIDPNNFDRVKLFYDYFLNLRKDYSFQLVLGTLYEGYNERLDFRYSLEHMKFIDDSRNKFVEVSKVLSRDKKEVYMTAYGDASYFINKDMRKEKSHISEDLIYEHELCMRFNMKRFNDFHCLGGVNTIFIDDRHNYYGATCKDMKAIGNIVKDRFIDWIKITTPVICKSYQCGCIANNGSLKFRDKDEAIEYINNYRIKILPLLMDNIYSQFYDMKKEIESLRFIVNEKNYNDEKINKFEKKYDKKFDNLIDTLAWFIPVKKWRDDFRYKFKETKHG